MIALLKLHVDIFNFLLTKFCYTVESALPISQQSQATTLQKNISCFKSCCSIYVSRLSRSVLQSKISAKTVVTQKTICRQFNENFSRWCVREASLILDMQRSSLANFENKKRNLC